MRGRRNPSGVHDAVVVGNARRLIPAPDLVYRSVAMSSRPARVQSRRTQAEAARMTSAG